jgi:hypothetical protein
VLLSLHENKCFLVKKLSPRDGMRRYKTKRMVAWSKLRHDLVDRIRDITIRWLDTQL